jgi:Tfp pilus assembly protein PilO
MTIVRRYQVLSVCVVALFLYLLQGEAFDRWDGAIRLYKEVEAREKDDATTLAVRKKSLIAREDSLRSLIAGKSNQYDQSETGVLEFLNASARDNGLAFQSLTPLFPPKKGQVREVVFTIHLLTGFHSVARFINTIETGPLIVRIQTLQLSIAAKNSAQLGAEIGGTAYIFPGASSR